MKRCVAIKNLTTGQTLKGAIVLLFRPQNTGIIRGDDGYDSGFHAVSVVGTSYRDLCVGDRVTYQFSFSKNGKIPTAMNVRPDCCSKQNPSDERASVHDPT